MPGFYTVEFYEDDDGRAPAIKWLDDLDDWKNAAAVAALTHVLSQRGKDVCNSEWGKNLGGGLYELRIRHTAAEIRHMFGGSDAEGKATAKVLLRIFFHPFGQARILVLSGYDKGVAPSARVQQREIERAQGYLQAFKRRRRS